MIIDSILHWAEGTVASLGSGGFLRWCRGIYSMLSFFIPSTSGLATVSMPLMGPLSEFPGVGNDLMITSYQSGSGLINLFAPTAGHLVAGLLFLKIPLAYLK